MRSGSGRARSTAMVEAAYARRPLALPFAGLALLALLTLLVALCAGSAGIPPMRVLAALTGDVSGTDARIVLDLRLPRVVAGFVTGSTLALAGALMQILLRNPLAEPYVLGVSGGSSVFALLAIAAGLGGAWVHVGAFAGALCSILLVFALCRGSSSWNPMRVL